MKCICGKKLLLGQTKYCSKGCRNDANNKRRKEIRDRTARPPKTVHKYICEYTGCHKSFEATGFRKYCSQSCASTQKAANVKQKQYYKKPVLEEVKRVRIELPTDIMECGYTRRRIQEWFVAKNNQNFEIIRRSAPST